MTNIDLNLLSDYMIEASEHLQEMESLLLKLAEEPESTQLLDEIFRPIHSIKGAAQFIGLEHSSRLAHRLEDLLDLLRKGERQSSPEVVDLLISARDRIVRLADELQHTHTETSSVDDMVDRITAEIEGLDTRTTTALPGSTEVYEDEPVQSQVSTSLVYEEENDQELFGIFLENLQEKIDLVRTQVAELVNSSDKVALLDRSAECIQALKSAANYMGYEELTCIYSNWLEDIVMVQEALVRNEDVPYDFMDGYLSEIVSIFPRLDQHTTAVKTADNSQADDDENNEETIIDQNISLDVNLLSDYLVEAAEHLQEMESLLLKLAKEPESTVLLDEIFRPIHSIKGAAQFIGLERSSRLAHRLEDLLDLLRKGVRQSSPDVVDLLISARDRIARLADELENTHIETSSVDDMVEQITAEIEGKVVRETVAVQENADVCGEEPIQHGTSATSGYGEENDQELFGIFLENLQEKIDLLRTQAAELVNSTDKIALLGRCTESIQALQLSANYMGYAELTHIYRNWLEDIVEVQAALGRNEDVPYDFMDGYLSEMISLFPRLDHQATRVAAEMKVANKDQLVKQEIAQEEEGKSVEENRYEKLRNALDTATSKSEEAEYELLHGVFEEMISEREEEPAEKRSGAVVNSKKQEISSKTENEPKLAENIQSAAADTAKDANSNQQTESRKQDQKVKSQGEKPAASKKADESVLKKSMRVDADKIDTLINQVGELVVDRAYFFQLFDDVRGLQQHFKDEIGLDQKEMKQIRAFTYRMGEAIASLSRTSNELQEGVMKVRMLPISQLFNRYPRLVHDLTRNNDKKVKLKVEGEDTELDKMVVEKLSDPLIHIIRNAVDHGLEDANERISAGKPETGTLYLKSYHESNQVVVEILDDGRGIDPELVKKKAIEKGIVTKNEVDRMMPQEVIRLITTAGFSTADEITGTSGRGVGMDVVRKNIEKLNGTLEIDSRPGKGTSIRLKIPLTLAIIPAHMILVGGNMYTIPLANIEETLRINRSETTIIEGTEVVYLRGKTLPVIHLSSLFNIRSQATDRDKSFVVVVNTGTQKIGLVVDELLGQEEVVIKPLVDYLRDKSGFSGATIIGDGSISLILDIYEIANMTASQQIRRQQDLIIARKSGIPDSHAGQAAG